MKSFVGRACCDVDAGVAFNFTLTISLTLFLCLLLIAGDHEIGVLWGLFLAAELGDKTCMNKHQKIL
jgi:hypothetical protein